MEAGEIAGLIVERIINEPTASALAYGYGLANDQHLRALVYDLGGGTFDVSIIELHSGVVDVLATAGDNLLGGDDFDERLAARIADEFDEEHHIDLREQHQAWARLLRAAEEAKIELSASPYAEIKLEYIAKDRQGKPLHIEREVERSEFEELIADLLGRTMMLIRKALVDAGLKAEEIDRVLLVGGSTRIPAVWDLIVAQMGQEPHIEIDPDAAVALGAAVQAGIIAGEEIDAILVDVTPYSLGIETAQIGYGGRLHGDLFTPLVRRNTTVPVHKSQVFSMLFPGQEQIHIKVYQGENPVASQNILLGDFMVEEPPTKSPRRLERCHRQLPAQRQRHPGCHRGGAQERETVQRAAQGQPAAAQPRGYRAEPGKARGGLHRDGSRSRRGRHGSWAWPHCSIGRRERCMSRSRC